MIAHAGHDHGAHHWLPCMIAALAVATFLLTVLLRRRCRQEDRR